MTEQVKFISQDYRYEPLVSGFGYVRLEVVLGYTTANSERDREMIYNRYSFSTSAEGPFEVLYEQPFGLRTVSGA